MNTQATQEINLETLSDEEAGMLVIDEADLELAHRVLERVVYENSQDALCPEEIDDGQDDAGPQRASYPMDMDDFLHLVEIQIRMNKGMNEFIRPLQEIKDAQYQQYADAKMAFQKAKDYLESYKKENGSIQGFPYWDRFNQLKTQRDEAYASMQRVSAELAKYWDHWKALCAEGQKIVGENRILWGQFFERFQRPVFNSKSAISTERRPVGENKFILVPVQELDSEAMADLLTDNEENLMFCGFDPEEIDDQVWLFKGHEATLDGLFTTHQMEERKYWAPESTSYPSGFWSSKEEWKSKKVAEESALQAELDSLDQLILDASQPTSEMEEEDFASQEATYAPF